ncbi:MAG: TRAP transporter substrate-binding protein DctP [Bryobacteraceae bacterium]|jgi:TRAP-type C4-dicarboxylate transport system substrate-binding protein
MLRRIVSAAAFLGLSIVSPAQKIDMATLAPADSTWYKVMENMGAEWKKISHGSVNLVIHPGGVLGDEPECVRRLDHRSIQAAGLSGAGLHDIDNGVACLQVPMMFDSYEELDFVRERIAPKLEQRLLQKGYVVLYWSEVGWVQFFSTAPVRRLDDLRKMRLFTWAGDATEEELWRTSGFRVVPLPATDIITQLKMHNLDAVPETALYAETTQLYSLTPYMCDVKWAPLVGATVISKQVWETIPESERGPMLAAAHKSGEALKDDIRTQGARAVTIMTAGQPGRKALKLTVTALDTAALAEWRTQTEALYPKMRDKMVPADLFDEVQRLRNQYRSQHPEQTVAQAKAGVR